MDGTLLDFEHPIKQALAEHGIDYADPTTDFYIAKRCQNPEVVDLIESIHNSRGFFEKLLLIDGTKETLELDLIHGATKITYLSSAKQPIDTPS